MSVIYTQGGASTIADATTTTAGKVRLATIAEAGGVSELIAVTPAGLQAEIAGLTGGLTYRGLIDVSAFATTLVNASQGDYYKIDTGGTAGDGRVYDSGDAIVINADMGGVYADAKLDKIDNVDPTTSDEITGNHNATSYAGTSTDSVTTHLDGIDSALALRAPIASPALTGTPTAPTALAGDSSLQIASTAFVAGEISAISLASTDLTDSADLARLASPALTGTPTAPTATAGDSSLQIASTAFVAGELSTLASTDLTDSADLARLASPALTGTPTTTTATAGDNSTRIASTAYVDNAVAGAGGATDLDGLSDVVITLASAGEVLKYDGSNWVDAQLASTELSDSADLARLASPALTGTPTAPTATAGDSSLQIASTAFVAGELSTLASTDLTDSADLARLASPALTGTPTAPTALAGDSSLQIASTAFVAGELSTLASTDLTDSADLARLASPALTGTPTTTTATAGDNSTRIASTAYVDNAVAGAGGATDLDGLSDVVITGASANEVLKYDGSNWVDAQLASTELSDSADLARLASPALTGTPTAPTATAGDSSLQIATTAFVAGEISASTGSDHDPSIVVLSTTSYNMQSLVTGGGLSASDVKNLHIWYGASNTSTFTVTLPLVADIISGLTSVNGGAGDTFEIYIGRGVGGDITINASDGIDLLGDGSVSYSTTHTLKPSQFLKVIGARFSSSRYILEAPSVQELDGLSDVVITLASAGEVLKYDGSDWVDAQLASTELSDSADLARLASPALTGTPTTTTATQGDNSTRIASTAYVDTAVAGAGGGATDLDGLSDVVITGASAGEILRYDGSNWVDAPLSIVDDPSPQLGGDLDLNGHGISSHLVPSATLDIGTASAEWRNLYLRDNGKILFGNDQDVELIHDPDDGLILDLGVADGTHDPQFELKSQSDGLFGPRLTFTADSASPASYDRIGQLRFQGRDSAGNLQDYAYIYGQVQDPTSGAEAGKITLTAYPSSANTRGLHVEGIAGNVLGAKVNIDHNGTDYGLHLNNTLVTSTANELNLLDGGATVGASVTILDTDGVILNDGGTTKLIPASDLKTYVGGGGGGTSYTYSAITSASSPVTAQAWYHYSADASGGAIALNLPALSTFSDGDEIRVKLRDASNALTITANGSENIDGSNTYVLDVAYSAITLVAGSTEWEVI